MSKKNGKLWATIMLEDLTGSVEINFFPATYQTVSTMLAQDAVAVVTCRVQYRDGSLQLSAQSMTLPQADIPDAPVDIQLPERMCTADLMSSLAGVLSLYPGAAPVRLHVHRPGLTSVVQVAEEYYVTPRRRALLRPAGASRAQLPEGVTPGPFGVGAADGPAHRRSEGAATSLTAASPPPGRRRATTSPSASMRPRRVSTRPLTLTSPHWTATRA